MKIILIPDRLDEKPEIEENIFGEGFKIITANAKKVTDIDINVWQNAEAILAWHDLVYDQSLISKLTKCKVIVRVGVGFDNVDLDAAKKAEIIVSNVPDYGTEDVANHAISLMLGLNRQLNNYHDSVFKSKKWDWNLGIGSRRLNNLTLGVIGCGRIGTALIQRAKAFGMKIIFYDPYISRGFEKSLQVLRAMELKDLTEISDIISFHVPLNHETRLMADDSFFSSLKKGCTIINTARGEVIDLDCLYEAMKTNRVSKIGLDVLEEEPINLNHPIFKSVINSEEWIRGRVIITPHCAFYCNESYIEMRDKAAHEAKRVLNGDPPLNRVN